MFFASFCRNIMLSIFDREIDQDEYYPSRGHGLFIMIIQAKRMVISNY